MQAELFSQLGASETTIGENGKKPEFDTGKQDLGIPKPKAVCRMASGASGWVMEVSQAGRVQNSKARTKLGMFGGAS